MNKDRTLIQKVESVTKEIITNWPVMVRVSMFDYRLRNRDSYLGRLWELFTPLIQIGTYWFVFGIGMRNGRDVDGYPYLLWMLSGLVPWFCISACILKGANSIFAKASVITKLGYPIATVPIGAVLTEIFSFAYSMAILAVVFAAYGYVPGWGWLNLIYYMIYLFLFLSCLALVTSVFTMIARDFQKLLSNIIRLLFYLTPILWDMEHMPQLYQDIIRFSPIYYIVRGFRDSLLYNTPFYAKSTDMAAAWAVIVFLFCLGCYLQEKFRSRFRDFM